MTDEEHPERVDMLADLFAAAYADEGEGGGERVTALIECGRETMDVRFVNLAKAAGFQRRWQYQHLTEDDA